MFKVTPECELLRYKNPDLFYYHNFKLESILFNSLKQLQHDQGTFATLAFFK
jgi:hypothetical protein